MIKKVVCNRPVEKKFPEFDVNKIYVKSNGKAYFRLEWNGASRGSFSWIALTEYITNCDYQDFEYYDTFQEACKDEIVFILNNEHELASFLQGGNFPIVEEKTFLKPLAADEVSSDDIAKDKIYATFIKGAGVYRAIQVGSLDAWLFTSGKYSCGSVDLDIKKAVLRRIKGCDCCLPGSDVYQFDTEEEYLRWALEKTTGKKFKTYTKDHNCNVGFTFFTPRSSIEVFS